jgi:WD40 repeat protein
MFAMRMHKLIGFALVLLTFVVSTPASADDAKADVPKVRLDAHGDPLPPGALLRLGTLHSRHSDLVTSVAWSRDGKLVASACREERLIIFWDPLTGKEVTRLRPHDSRIWGMDFSPDGKWLASCGGDSVVSLQEMARLGHADSKPRQLRPENSHGFSRVLFLPDSKSLVTTELQHGIHVWDVATAKPIREFGLDWGDADRIAMAPDGKTIAVGHCIRGRGRPACQIHLWDLATGKEIRQIGPDQETLWSLAFSADGATLAFGSQASPSVWEVATGKPLVKLDRAPAISIISCVAFSPDGKSLLASGDGFLAEWSLTTGHIGRSFPVGTTEIWSLGISPDGKSIVTGGSRTVGLWDLATTKPKLEFAGHQGEVNALVFTGDEKELITEGSDKTIYRWDLATGKPIARFASRTPKTWRPLLLLSPDGKKLLTQENAITLVVLDAATGKERARLVEPTKPNSLWPMLGAGFAPDSKTVISFSSGGDPNIRIRDAESGEEKRVLPIIAENINESRPSGITFSPDRKTLYVANMLGPVRVLDVATGKEARQFGNRDNGSRLLTVSSDGRLLAYISDKGIGAWDTASGKQLREWTHPSRYSAYIGFSPDGRTLAVCKMQEPLRLWEIASGQSRLEVSGHAGPVTGFAFSPDGRFLATGSDDTTALLWNLHSLALVKSPSVAQLTPKLLDTLWSDLFGDAPVAYRAVARLSEFPKQTVAFLGDRLSTAEVKPPDKLFGRLDDENLDIRESATKELLALGMAAEPSIRKVLGSTSSIEVRVRLEKILAQVRLGPLRALEVLEAIDTPEALKLVEGLAKGMEASELTFEAKATLARMERKARHE